MIEQYYRYEEILISSVWYRVKLYLKILNVIKHTPCGVWLELPYGGGKRFVLKYARKQYALPTKEEALLSYYARKRIQIKIFTAKLEIAKAALEAKPEEVENE